MEGLRQTLASCLVAWLAGGCGLALDAGQATVDTGSFATTVLTVACKRMAYRADLADGDGVVDVRGDAYRDICRNGSPPREGAPPALWALQAERPVLIAALDRAVPAVFLPDLQRFLTSPELLALYDRGAVSAAVADLNGLFRFFAQEPELAPALELLAQRRGYRPLSTAAGASLAVANYPQLGQLLDGLLGAVAERNAADQSLGRLLAAASVTLRHAGELAPRWADGTGQLVVDTLLAPRSLLATGQSLPLVRRDDRGVARVALRGGAVPPPFADKDGDGRADLDALGRYVDESGRVIDAPTPFVLAEGSARAPWPFRDPKGRALHSASGDPIYEYLELDATLLAALTRDLPALFASGEGTPIDLAIGAAALLGSGRRPSVVRSYGDGERFSYPGFEVDRDGRSWAPLLDLIYGYLGLLRDPGIGDLLALARELVVAHEPEVARVLEALIDAAEVADRHPDAKVAAAAPLWDDLMPLVEQLVATPGLAEGLVRALENPQVAELALRVRDHMRFRDWFGYDQDQKVTGAFATAVDRSGADAEGNRSLFQRLLHLIHDASGVSLCNKQDAVVRFGPVRVATYNKCELVRVEDLAVFFVRSIVGAAEFDFRWGALGFLVTDAMIESAIGIEGFRTRPTPEALSRALFLDPMPQGLADMIDPPLCRDGDLIRVAHGGTLPAWEREHFYDQVRPVIQVFVDHGREKLLVDLLALLHRHWPSPNSWPTHQVVDPTRRGYVWGSNTVSYEPLLVAMLDRRAARPEHGHVVDALGHAARNVRGVVINGRSPAAIVASAARYLFTPRPGLADRLGNTTATTSDGRPVTVLSPWRVLADAYERKRQRRLEGSGGALAWERGMSRVSDVFFRGEVDRAGTFRFRNPRLRGLALAVLNLVRERLDEHDRLGDRDRWLAAELPSRAKGLVTGPLFAAVSDFLADLSKTGQGRTELEKVVRHLGDDAGHRDSFAAFVTGAADLLQWTLDERTSLALAHSLGRAIAPERGWARRLIYVASAVQATDRESALARLIQQLYWQSRPDRHAIGDLAAGIAEVHRAHPYRDRGLIYSSDDYRALFGGVADFLGGETVQALVRLVQSRRGGQSWRSESNPRDQPR